jgi:hypothetical protein
MSNPNERGDDEELREAVSKNESFAEWGGAAVVFGLVVEVVLTSAFRHGQSAIETWGPVFADTLIALGVAAEILFARKARSKAETLQRGSDEKVAHAMLKASEADARAAEANQKAQESALELVNFRAARSISNENSSQIAERLHRFAGTPYDVAISSNDSEITTFQYVLHGMLKKAGWTALPWGQPSPRMSPIFGPEVGLGYAVSNVTIDGGAVYSEQAKELANELKTAGIEAVAIGVFIIGPPNTNNAVHIMIGRKT